MAVEAVRMVEAAHPMVAVVAFMAVAAASTQEAVDSTLAEVACVPLEVFMAAFIPAVDRAAAFMPCALRRAAAGMDLQLMLRPAEALPVTARPAAASQATMRPSAGMYRPVTPRTMAQRRPAMPSRTA